MNNKAYDAGVKDDGQTSWDCNDTSKDTELKRRTCAVEHVEPQCACDAYRYKWELPTVGALGVDDLANELLACRNANRGHHVRVVGYDSLRQTRGLGFVVYRYDPTTAC